MSAEEWLDSPVYRTAYTVIQHVKRVYRKLDVDSRVTLARALLRPPAPAVRPR